MNKLIKPKYSIENLSDEVIEAFCDHDNCGGNCKSNCDDNWGCTGDCSSVGSVEPDDDILF